MSEHRGRACRCVCDSLGYFSFSPVVGMMILLHSMRAGNTPRSWIDDG